jgi:transcriptional regulator with GAF, ATPase, and Fis domain
MGRRGTSAERSLAPSARETARSLAHHGLCFWMKGELPPALQAQLLRAIQKDLQAGRRQYVAADRFPSGLRDERDLLADVKGGVFRSDLYYRIPVGWCTRRL